MTSKLDITPRTRRLARLLGAASLLAAATAAFAAAAAAQPTQPPADQSIRPRPTQDDESRRSSSPASAQSLTAALGAKRDDTGIVDVIVAEDIADFPDQNLAESLQRIPGVAIDRDAGEGRQITVRGLGGDFTRVRLNQLEALATTGGTDSSGGANRSRAFDFNVFASELFSRLTVRKSASAEVDEGSLGATVDLQTARPFDYHGFVISASGQMGYNDLARRLGPARRLPRLQHLRRRPARRPRLGRLQPARPVRGRLQLGPLGRRQQRRRLLLAGRARAAQPDRRRRQLRRQSQHSGLHRRRRACPTRRATRPNMTRPRWRPTSIRACRATAG